MIRHDLSEGSKSYHQEAYVYELFSQAEDAPGRVLDLLRPLVLHKYVLDIGCGTGKYLVNLAPHALRYIGLDISKEQLEITKSKAKELTNVDLICSSAESIQLGDESIDTVISSWVFGTILDLSRREKSLNEAERVLCKEGRIYLVENDLGGDFEFIRGRYPDTSRTKQYNEWLEQHGFIPYQRLSTYFDFNDVQEAKRIFQSIWGKEASDRVSAKLISHNIVVYFKQILLPKTNTI